MSELLSEIGLRLAKVLAAALVGLVLYLVAIGPGGASASIELGLLAFIAGAVAILLVESSPI
jgi:hypothetical protein